MRFRHVFAPLAVALLASYAAHSQQASDSLAVAAPPDPLYRVSSSLDSLGQCTEVLNWGTPAALVRVFYPTGQLRSYVPFANLALGVRHGMVSSWFANGQAATLEPFVEGRRHGELVCYYENGRLRRQANFQAGTELHSACYDAAGRPQPYFPYEQPPLYPGGLAQLTKEINQRLRWPREVGRLPYFVAIQVKVSVLIDENGAVREPRVDEPSCAPALDQAVLRALLQLSRPWQPGRLDGHFAAFRYRLPIDFTTRDASRARF